ILVVFGWLLFGGFWWAVLQQGPHSLSNIIWLLAIALVVLPIITLYWVMHNRGIHARKGPRRQVQVVESAYAQDWAGRPVHARFDQLRQARLITIHSTADEKYFLTPTDSLQPILEAA
ncbi:MAG TPA: hypothetical protein VFX83_05630, partial [Azonexus sp.]|nr:hypothetical protein [Azonexus sp.]